MSYLEKAGCCEQRARWNPTTEGEVGGWWGMRERGAGAGRGKSWASLAESGWQINKSLREVVRGEGGQRGTGRMSPERKGRATNWMHRSQGLNISCNPSPKFLLPQDSCEPFILTHHDNCNKLSISDCGNQPQDGQEKDPYSEVALLITPWTYEGMEWQDGGAVSWTRARG